MSGTADREIESVVELERVVGERGHLRGMVLQGLTLADAGVDWTQVDVARAVFVACRFPSYEVEAAVRKGGAVVIPDLDDGRPYRLYPPRLYTYEELGASGADAAIQDWFNRHGKPEPADPIEAIAQRLHDTAMSEGIGDFVTADGRDPARVVGIMGGHRTSRTTRDYERVVHLAFRLTRAGYLVVTGGGPGIMEAGNLGAYLTRGEGEGEVDLALLRLREAPVLGPGYAEAAEDVHRRLADRPGGESLAIPTWNYEGEPIGRFATHIAKYFANSIREDGLLRLARAGIVFAPGGAGTVQEVFQDGAINAYAERPSDQVPMVFLGREHFEASGVYALAKRMAAAAPTPYAHMLKLTDDLDEAVAHIESPPPPRGG